MSRRAFIVLALFLGCAVPALACFGPKLYIGVEPGVQGELDFALVSLYVKEKTGVEAVRVELAAGEGAAALAAERVDLAVVSATSGGVLTLTDGRVLLAGKRVRDDLQFTTVLPALGKLQGLLAGADGPALLAQVRSGAGALAVARAFFKEKRAL